MTHLTPIAQSAGYAVLAIRQRNSVSEYIRKWNLWGLSRDVAVAWLSKLYFKMRIQLIRNAEVVLIHPQTIGWGNVLRLCKYNAIRLYVMDNSFFCIQSYNHRRNANGECLDCLGHVDACDASCRSYPINYRKRANLAYLRAFSQYATKIRFYVQTASQARLLEGHYGRITYDVIGLATHEFHEGSVIGLNKPRRSHSREFDVVYHAAVVEAKGIKYFIELAEHLPELRFLVPGSKNGVRSLFPELPIPGNIVFQSMSWETGLREQVESCRLVVCPSLWSAPIEGALIKSIMYNRCVAVYKTKYGFHNELPDNIVLRIDHDLPRASSEVRRYIAQGGPDRNAVHRWIREFIQMNHVDRLFQRQ